MIPHDIIIISDFNIHVGDESDVDASRFSSILDWCVLTQHITDRTHKWGHTLDIVLSRESCPVVADNDKSESSADHLAVQFITNMDKPSYTQKTKTHHKYCDVNMSEFRRCPTCHQAPCSVIRTIIMGSNVPLYSKKNIRFARRFGGGLEESRVDWVLNYFDGVLWDIQWKLLPVNQYAVPT